MMMDKALAPTAEYALEVEVIVIGESVVVRNDWDRFAAGHFQPGKMLFPAYSLGNSDKIPDLLTLFLRDFWDSLGSDVGTDEVRFSIQDWSG